MPATDDIRQQAVELVDTCMADTASEHDIAMANRQLGRYPRGMVAVGARCVCGRPLVVITRPLLADGTPFPTTCYLTSPEAVKAVSQVEAAGTMQDDNTLLQTNAQMRHDYQRAHLLYLAFRHELATRLGDSEEHIVNNSAGGMPTRVKCLHALVAQSLVMGRGINPIGDKTLDAIHDQFDPKICRCTTRIDDE